MMPKGSTYQRQMTDDKCHRCEILYDSDFPRVLGKNICEECEYEIANKRMNNNWSLTDILQNAIMELRYDLSSM